MTNTMTTEERERWGKVAHEAWWGDAQSLDGIKDELPDEYLSWLQVGTAVATAAIAAERERVRAILQPMIDRANAATHPHQVNFEAGYWEGLFDALDAISAPVGQAETTTDGV